LALCPCRMVLFPPPGDPQAEQHCLTSQQVVHLRAPCGPQADGPRPVPGGCPQATPRQLLRQAHSRQDPPRFVPRSLQMRVGEALRKEHPQTSPSQLTCYPSRELATLTLADAHPHRVQVSWKPATPLALCEGSLPLQGLRPTAAGMGYSVPDTHHTHSVVPKWFSSHMGTHGQCGPTPQRRGTPHGARHYTVVGAWGQTRNKAHRSVLQLAPGST
jgi:hypothetical protein